MGRYYLLACCLLCVASGCAQLHGKLADNSTNQAWSVGNMQEQQVLDNLAMFACNYNSMPHFSYPNQSGSQVTDQVNANASVGGGRPNAIAGAKSPPLLLTVLGLSGGGQRSQQEAFTVTPVNDPRKLELMRCAYQMAIRSCGRGAVAGTCPDCQTRFKIFYTGDPNGDIRQGANGIVTSECLNANCCWFHVGCKRCWEKYGSCGCHGEFCGVHVWVTPEGRDELTKLTLAILDYALHDPPVKRTKQVEYYLDEYGMPTTQKFAVGKVTAVIAIDERNEALLKGTTGDEVALERFLDYRHKHVKEKLANATDPDERRTLLEQDQMLERKLDFLHEELRQGGLKEEFYPRLPAPTGPNILQLDLYQSTMPGFGSP